KVTNNKNLVHRRRRYGPLPPAAAIRADGSDDKSISPTLDDGPLNRRQHFPDTDDEDDGPRYNYLQQQQQQQQQQQVSNAALPPPSTCSHSNRALLSSSAARSPIILPPTLPSVTDRVTIDMALFMHLVDTYSTSGDNLKRMRLCSLMQFMIEEFVPPLPTSHENRGDEGEDESGGVRRRRPLKCLPFGSFTYNLHLPWASDLDFVLLPASRRYERLLAPAKVAAGHHHHHPQQSDTSANPYQSE
ncbi:hypothetical protein FOZ63_006907, partial [Perkinsus olseni]